MDVEVSFRHRSSSRKLERLEDMKKGYMQRFFA